MVDERNEGQSPLGGRTAWPWLFRVVASIRFFVAFAVLGTFLSAIALYLYATYMIGNLLWDTITVSEEAGTMEGLKHLQVAFVELTDVYLLGTVLVVVALGLTQLFLQADLPLPPWLRIHSLDQLAARLIEVVAVLLSVTFLAFAVEPGPGADILRVGVGFAVVISALGLLLVVMHWLGESRPPPAD